MKTLALLFSLLSITTFAKSWHINPDHSEILFDITYLKFSTVTGNFSRFKGKIELEQEQIKSLEILISSDSISTGNSLRDGHLRRNDFFQTKTYPTITFLSQEIKNNSIMGILKIKGKKKQVTFNIKRSPIIKDAWNKDSFFTTFTAKVNRKDFNMNWNQALDSGELVLSDTINIHGSIQWQEQSNKTLGSKHLIADTLALRDKNRAMNTKRVEPGNLEHDLIIKTDNKNKMLPRESTPIPFSKWFSYAFLWLTSLGGIIFASYQLKMKTSSWVADLAILIIVLIFSIASFELMPL